MKRAKLSREVGVVFLLFYGLGNILGAGIYVLVGKVAGLSGYFSVFAFLLACVIAFFTALSYMELASRYPVSAGAAVYIEEGTGSKSLSVSFGLLIAAAVLVSAATITHGFVGYIQQIFPIHEVPAIILLLLLLVGIAIKGIKTSVIVASVLTLIEIFGLLLIIYLGFDKVIHPSISFHKFIPGWSFTDVSAIFMGAFLAFYAFLGFEDMVNIAEEVKEPAKTFPIAISLALAISTLLYVLIVIVALESLSLDELQNSQAPFADIYNRLTGRGPVIISLIAAFAVVNGALIQIIMASRIMYGMAEKGWLPPWLAEVSPRTKTPINATLLAGIATLVFALTFDLVSLAAYTSMLILIIFSMVNISLIRIKSVKHSDTGIMHVPLWVPWVGLSLNLLLIFMKLFFEKG